MEAANEFSISKPSVSPGSIVPTRLWVIHIQINGKTKSCEFQEIKIKPSILLVMPMGITSKIVPAYNETKEYQVSRASFSGCSGDLVAGRDQPVRRRGEERTSFNMVRRESIIFSSYQGTRLPVVHLLLSICIFVGPI